MYREHFGLTELPFSIAPNPRYLYLTHQHQEALAHLVYGLNSAGGVILLTGEVGTGKTTISRKLLEDIPDNIVIAWIVNPRLSVEELLAAICDELSINYPKGNRSIKIFTDLISNRLIQAHGRNHNVVLMIDEAQNLSPEVLEQLRLLTNLETNERKLLQIILLGQPELKTMLERNDLRQLAQRITARYHLHPLSRQETGGYIRHRLAVAGCSKPVFTPRAMKLIYHLSHGTPRLINLLCDRAMLGVYSVNAAMVHPKHVRQAGIEVLGETGVQKRSVLIPVTIVLLLTATGIFATGTWKQLANDGLQQHSAQVSATLPSPAQKTEASPPSITISHVTIPKTMPEIALVQTHQPELTEKVALEALPMQPSKAVPPVKKDITETTPANETIIEPIKKDKTISQAPVTPWDIIEKSGTKILAFQTLAKIWHSTVVATEAEPCEQLSDNRLSCMKQRANIWLIRAMNRPAIFQIPEKDGDNRYGVIRFISHGQAVIQLGMQQWRIKLSELKQHLQGRVSVIWFKPPGYQQDLQQGDSGKTVAWLARQLDRIQGTMIPPRQMHNMDDVLTERLKDFQRSEGITADGIAGILTLMRINEHIGLDIPRLLGGAKH